METYGGTGLFTVTSHQKTKTKRIMKRNIIIMLVLAQALLAEAQINISRSIDYEDGEPVDTALYSVGYDFAFVKDAEKKPYKPIHEQMTLEIGRHAASFYSYAQFLGDSVAAEAIKKGEHQFRFTHKVSWRMYANYPAKGQYSYLERFGMDRFVMTEKQAEPEWTLCADSVSTILGYQCRKATATFLGREWTAWYTEDIPLDNGPWLLHGLPGLIMKAETADSCFCFEANGLTKCADSKPMYYKGGKYEKIDRKALASVYKRYFADPVGYISNGANVKVITMDDKGNKTNDRMTSPYCLLDKTMMK